MKSIHEWQVEQAFSMLTELAGTNPVQGGFVPGENEDLDAILGQISQRYRPLILKLATKLQTNSGGVNTPKRKAAIIAMFMSALGVDDLASLAPVLAIVKKYMAQGVVAGAAAGATPAPVQGPPAGVTPQQPVAS